MKSNDAAGSHLLPSRMTSSAPVYNGLGDPGERSTNAVMLLVVVVAIVALYAAMFASVYLWSRYAPVFPPDTGDIAANVGAIP
jgi:hypothetical protein